MTASAINLIPQEPFLRTICELIITVQQRKRRGGGKSPLFHPILFTVGEGGETRDCGANKSTFPSHDWRHISLPPCTTTTIPALMTPSPDKKSHSSPFPLRDICCRIWAIRYSLPRQQCRERCYLPAFGFFSPLGPFYSGVQPLRRIGPMGRGGAKCS